MTLPIAHIFNGELGFDVRTKLNDLIDLAGGGSAPFTPGSVPFADASGFFIQDNANFFWDNPNNLLTSGVGLKIKGATSGIVTINTKAAAGTWTLTLPDTGGTSGYTLTTNGSGVTSWTSTGGSGGSTILNGSGVPSTSLGAIGDYYIDDTGNQMYGPKEVLTAGPDQITIPPSLLPVTSSGGPVELSGHFTFAVAGDIVALRYYRDAGTAQIAHTVSVWTTGGSLLASASTANDGGGSGWKQLVLTPALSVTASTTLVVSTGYTGSLVRTNSAAFPISNGGDVTLVGSSWGGAVGSFPPNADAANFFIDLVFQAAMTPTPYWPMAVDGDVGGGGGMAIGGAVTGGASGSILFVDSGINLAQDATFFWDNATNDLHIGGSYYVDTFKALYRVPNAQGDNWFEGNSGNLTVTGSGNFGTGDGSLRSLTTGSSNMAVGGLSFFVTGKSALQSLTSGNNNTGIGTGALGWSTTGNNNAAIGNAALGFLGNVQDGSNNFAVGTQALGALGGAAGSANQNTAIGVSCAQNLYSSVGGVFIGNQVGGGGFNYSLSSTIVGNGALQQMPGNTVNNATVLGAWFAGPPGLAAIPNGIIVLASGLNSSWPAFDCNFTTPFSGGAAGFVNSTTWSFNPWLDNGSAPVAVHIYNAQDNTYPHANWERGIFSWTEVANVLMIGTQAGGTGVKRLIAIDGFPKAGAPAAGDLPASSFSVIDDTSAGQTWLVFNKAGTIRKVQLT